MRWQYDNSDPGDVYDNVFSETNLIFATFGNGVDLSNYDQLRVKLKRHGGNSEERILYVKFYNYFVSSGFIQAEADLVAGLGGTHGDPNEWVDWTINLNDLAFKGGATSLSDLDDVVGIFFGTVGGLGYADAVWPFLGEGDGTIDIDEIVLVDLLSCMGNPVIGDPSGDFNRDCRVDLLDFALFGSEWMQY